MDFINLGRGNKPVEYLSKELTNLTVFGKNAYLRFYCASVKLSMYRKIQMQW